MSPDSGQPAEFLIENDEHRLEVLRQYCILDTGSDPVLDTLTDTAARIFGTPIAIVSLVDEDRQYFKSRHGIDICETLRDGSFCNTVVTGAEPLVVLDASKDVRFSDNPYVANDPHIRFYAGVPLVDPSGVVLGSFCIIDTQPHPEMDQHNINVLRSFADQAVEVITTTYPNIPTTTGISIDPTGLFSSFVKDIPLAAAMLDKDLRYLAASDSWYKIFQVESLDLIGQSFLGDALSLSNGRVEFFQAMMHGGQGETNREVQFKTRSGEPLWLRCDTQHWYTKNGDIGGIIMFRSVIDEEIQARTEADKTQRLFETFFFHNPTHMYVKSLDGEYQLYNKAFAVAHGLDDGQTGLHTADLFSDETAEQLSAIDAEVLQTGNPVDGHIDVVVGGETQQRLEVRKFPVLGEDGEPWAIGGVSIDVTNQQKMEEAFRQAQKMEAVGNLTGGIAHDFNNILAVILGNLQLLQRYIEADSKESARLSGAVNATLRGARLTKQLLAFSRRQELEPAVIDINDTLKDLHKMISRTLSETIEIDLQLTEGIPYAFIDEGQLQNCVLNLSINARDAMPEGGKLQIETREIFVSDDAMASLDGLSAGNYVTVSITDTGCGMSKEVKSRVFEPFFTTKGVGKGTGLGLAMVYGFIKQSEGHVTIYSEVGHGTTIRMYLPVASADATIEEPAVVEMNSEMSGRILVVEDDEAVRGIVQAMLEDLGYELAEAESGAEALKILEAGEQFDLIFSDVIMPGGMTGVDLARIVAQRRPDIPVLLTSGYPRDAVKSDVSVHILPKPYQQHQLAEEIVRTIAAHKESSQ